MKTISIKSILLAVSSLSIIFISSCKKDTTTTTTDAVDTEKPVVIITSPKANNKFMNGDTIRIQGTATENDELHEMKITLKNTTKDTLLFSETPVVHALKSYTINTMCIAKAIAHSDCVLTITASDHSSNVTTVTVPIMLMP